VCVCECTNLSLIMLFKYYCHTVIHEYLFCSVFCSRPRPCVVYLTPAQRRDYTYEDHMIKRAADSIAAQERILCPNNCGRSYKRVEHMKRHLGYECGVDPRYECHVCHRKFVYNFSMKKHMFQIHKELIENSDT